MFNQEQNQINKIIIEKFGNQLKTFVSENAFNPKNKKALFIDTVYYNSEFQAGIDSEISFQWISKLLNKSNGQPAYCERLDKYLIPEKWIRENIF